MIIARERNHDGIVSGEGGGGDTKSDACVLAGDVLRKDAADMRVGRDSATYRESLSTGRFKRSCRLPPQHVRDRVFELASEPLLFKRREPAPLLEEIEHRCLQPTEGEVAGVIVNHRSRQRDGFRKPHIRCGVYETQT